MDPWCKILLAHVAVAVLSSSCAYRDRQHTILNETTAESTQPKSDGYVSLWIVIVSAVGGSIIAVTFVILVLIVSLK